ncbi:hypothetical protein H4I96_10506 [Botrytis cinerea]
MALGSDSSKMVLVLMDMPFCGRPRKPRPLISVTLSASAAHMFDIWFLILETDFGNPLGTYLVFQVLIDSGHHHLHEGCSIRILNCYNPLDSQFYGINLFCFLDSMSCQFRLTSSRIMLHGAV